MCCNKTAFIKVLTINKINKVENCLLLFIICLLPVTYNELRHIQPVWILIISIQNTWLIGTVPRRVSYKAEWHLSGLVSPILKNMARELGIGYKEQGNTLTMTFRSRDIYIFEKGIEWLNKQNDTYKWIPEQIDFKSTSRTIEIEAVILREERALNSVNKHNVEGLDLLRTDFERGNEWYPCTWDADLC
eukprot:716791_1